MKRIVKEEDVVALIHQKMKTRQLRSEDVRKEGERMHIHGLGEYDCEYCPHEWSSYFSWITIDLKEKKISKRWLMKCQGCNRPYKPYFEIERITKMIDLAISLYKGEYSGTRSVDIGRGPLGDRPPPHMPNLCEKCKWGDERCWMYRYRFR